MNDYSYNSVEDFLGQIVEVIDHLDAAPAARYLKRWSEFVNAISQDQKANVGFAAELERLRVRLKLVAFPDLSDDECARIFRESLLEFFVFDIPLDDRLEARYAFQGYHVKNEVREILKKAILENRQKIGPLSVGEWLTDFDKQYDVETRTKQDILNFLTQNPKAAQLRKDEMHVIKKIFSIYEDFLASRIVDVYDLAAYDQSISRKSSGYTPLKDLSTKAIPASQPSIGRVAGYGSMGGQDRSKGFSASEETLSLLDALAKYPRINDQQITDERIRVKSEKELVRPTVRNWLRAYRDVLGVRRHTAIERGQFIFGSENAKKLSSAERDRLATLFKSLDENEPLSVDPTRQEIVFPVRQITQPQPRTDFAPVENGRETQTQRPMSNVIRPTIPAVQPPSSLASVVAPQTGVQQSVEPQSISFSSGHVLPAEKAASAEPALARVPSAPRHNFSSQNSPRLSVERPTVPAQPVAPAKKEVWQIPAGLANVVDLRSGDE